MACLLHCDKDDMMCQIKLKSFELLFHFHFHYITSTSCFSLSHFQFIFSFIFIFQVDGKKRSVPVGNIVNHGSPWNQEMDLKNHYSEDDKRYF